MSDLSTVPDHWYKYEFPLPKVNGAPVPSQADYSPKNVAWLLEMFGGIIGEDHTNIAFRYENNTQNSPNDDIFVAHPGDKLYHPKNDPCKMTKSAALTRYEKFAKKSARLKLFEENSPAGIEYFKPLCQ